MKSNRILFAVPALIIALSSGFAQTTRRGTSRQPTAKPAATPAPVAQPTPAPAPSINESTVAVINEQTISASDIEPLVNEAIMKDPDPYLRDYYTDAAKAIREARQRAVDSKVASMLI